MSPRDTVYDRFKRTGYLTGSKHNMGPAMEDAALPEASAAPEDAAGGPPNLRDSGGEPESCGDCLHFESGQAGAAVAEGPRGNAIGGVAGERSSCSKYGGYPVTVNQVCDDYEPVAAEEPGEGPPVPSMPEEV